MAETKYQYPECAIQLKVGQGGIYSISNRSNNKIYIGSAVDFGRRFCTHRCHFQRRNHENRYLQRAFDNNPSDFEFFVVEELKDFSKSNMLSREQFWIDFYKSYVPENGYNICRTAGSCRGNRLSEETKLKLSLALKGRRLSPEHCQKISNALHLRIRKPLTKEHIKKMVEGRIAHPNSAESDARGAEKRQSQKNRWRRVIQMDLSGNEIQTHDSIVLAARCIGYERGKFNISTVCQGKRKAAMGYGWKYA